MRFQYIVKTTIIVTKWVELQTTLTKNILNAHRKCMYALDRTWKLKTVERSALKQDAWPRNLELRRKI